MRSGPVPNTAWNRAEAWFHAHMTCKLFGHKPYGPMQTGGQWSLSFPRCCDRCKDVLPDEEKLHD